MNAILSAAALACCTALAVTSLPAQAAVTETSSTLLDDFDGVGDDKTAFAAASGFSFFSGQSANLDLHVDGGDAYIRVQDDLSLVFNAETALSSLNLSFWYTACNYQGAGCASGDLTSATVSLNGPNGGSVFSAALGGAMGTNPGGGIGSNFSQTFGDLAAGDYTLRFDPVGGSVIFKLDDVALTSVSAVPEPATLALLLGGLAIVGVATRRRAKDAAAA